MSKPTRNVPYKLQLLNPSRRMARSMVTLPPLHALPEVAAAGPSSPTSSPPYSQMASQMASQMGSAVGSNFMTTSQSLPLLQPIDSEIARSRLLDDPRHYRKDHLTIWGGADYMRTRIKVKSKYLERFQLQGDAAERARLRKLESIKKLMRESARIFQKADEDGDGMLNFYEFCNLIKLQSRLQRRAHLLSDNPTAPTDFAPLPTREMLKDWFHLIDANHSGSLSMTEFFAFSLREALAQTMDGPPNITAFLSIWDTDQDNKLDSDELQKATHALGFSAITRELLEMCEVEADGESIKIAQVTAALREKAESEEARPFFEVAGAIAQRPIESVSKDASKKAKKAADEAAEGEGDASSARAPKKKSPMRGPNSGKANEALFPPMDARTSFAITMALGRIDQRAKDDKFYDPADEATRKKEDVGQALSILRSWMRLKALKALEVFQSWDQVGSIISSLGLTALSGISCPPVASPTCGVTGPSPLEIRCLKTGRRSDRLPRISRAHAREPAERQSEPHSSRSSRWSGAIRP